MRRFPVARRSFAVFLAVVPGLSCVSQTFAAPAGAEAVIGTIPPPSVRVEVPGHRRHAEEKLLYGQVRDGVYTVDGMVAKVQLNYDVKGVRFLYLFAPGVGTAVLSAAADPDAVVVNAAYREGELSFHVGEHRFNLTGVTLASDKGVAPAHLYVRLDRAAWRLNRRPMLGYGDLAALPYQWPGALPAVAVTPAEEAQAVPPVPANLLPSATPVIPATPAAGEPEPPQPASLR